MLADPNPPIPYHQYLDVHGHPTQTLPEWANHKDITLSLYRQLILTRTFDQKAVRLQRTGKIGTYASSLGQEAIGVALGQAMRKEDVLFPAYREYGVMLARGVQMIDILSYWGGRESGNHYQHCKDFPMAVPIASQCLHAAGAAFAFKYRKEPRVAVTVLGDGGTSQGDFYEAMNAAGTWYLPVLFVINNNQWAISMPRHQQTASKTLAQKAIAAGLPALQVDGNDLIALVQVFETLLARIRQGKGACVVEALTYRLCDHTTADDANRYWDKEKTKQAWQHEPVRRFRSFIEHQYHWDPAQETQLIETCEQTVNQVAETYLALPTEPPVNMIDFLYDTCPRPLHRQRDTLLAMTHE